MATPQLEPSAFGLIFEQAFNAPEKVLLTAIPAAIRRTCEPRRDQNPAGTVAVSPELTSSQEAAIHRAAGEVVS